MSVFNLDNFISSFVILWAVIDPFGTVPVFITVTKGYDEIEKRKIARFSSIVAFCILLFFMIVGEYILKRVGVPLAAFQISGGVILFLFASNMIFGSSKPEEEIQLVQDEKETAIFPLAIPSIAGPGAILAVVLLADTTRNSFASMLFTIFILIIVLLINFILMLLSSKIHKRIGNSGAIVISKVMGLILASMAANNILLGIKEFFKIV
ncbi:MarC family protein [Halobacteriovorax sp. HLS]|uniref:MarC family protein n=1 Tax=Halobacteriovorax sp. HLS TaxID=2234000 RepID=UPI000FDAF3CA|nr:MarC family protein [Halobacteriovorax sp. HLS]